MRVFTALLLAAAFVTPLAAQDAAGAEAAFRHGQSALQSNELDTAIADFKKATELDPANGRAWHMLGYSLHMANRLDEALPVHMKASEFKDIGHIAAYNVACVHALKKDADKAIEWLGKAVAMGFNDRGQIAGDSDFDSLRNDPRFKKIVGDMKDSVRAFSVTTERRSARVMFFAGQSSPAQVAIDYAVLPWQSKFDEAVDSPEFRGKKWRFGSDFWTSLDNSVPLVIAGVEIPAGYWYLTLENRGDQKFVLGVHDPVEVRKLRIDPFRADRVKGGIEVPLAHRAVDTVHKELAIALEMRKPTGAEADLTIRFGGHELTAEAKVVLSSGDVR